MQKRALIFYIAILFIGGVLFRLTLVKFFPQPFEFDQVEYEQFAKQIFNTSFYASPSRLYGYPLVISVIYKLFGIGNHEALFIFQAILDSLTAVFVFLISKELFSKYFPSLAAFILYLFNPYTSAYTGVGLSEIPVIFLIAVSFYLFILIIKKKSIISLILMGGVLGYLVQVRPTFFYFSLLLLLYVILYIFWKNKKNISKLLFISAGVFIYILTFFYNIIGNNLYFHQFSLLTVDNLTVSQFYISLYMEKSPLYAKSMFDFPVQVQNLLREYSVLPKNAHERKMMADKYMKVSIEKVNEDLFAFLSSRIRRAGYVWEKKGIFYYKDPDIPYLYDISNSFNIGLIGIFIIGYYLYWKKIKTENGESWKRHFMILSFIFVIYITIVHTFTTIEERYSLPAYPIIMIFAGWGIYKALTIFGKNTN